MTIFVDPTETRAGSRLPAMAGSVVVNGLEALTGADMMLSVYAAPATSEALIRAHVRAGALLVQRKSGEDLINSMGAHLNSALDRMWTLTKRPGQCVLLFSGILSADSNGMAVIDGRMAHRSYMSVLGGMSRWHDRGGVVETLAGDEHIPSWCEMKLTHLREYCDPSGEVKHFYPDTALRVVDKSDPLQMLIKVNDGRVTLATLPGIGAKTADDLWTWGGGNLARILDALCAPATLKREDRPRGIGPATIRAVRSWMGYEEPQIQTKQKTTQTTDEQPITAGGHA